MLTSVLQINRTGTPTTLDASERFCIPAALREVSNDRVKLIPFNVGPLTILHYIKNSVP